MENKKQILVLGGGTVSHVRAHLALSAPAYGTTAKAIYKILNEKQSEHGFETKLILTKMAGGDSIETHQHVENLVEKIIQDQNVRAVFFNMALVDFSGKIGKEDSGKYAPRLKTSTWAWESRDMVLTPTKKIIDRIRKERKDIFVVGFKTTCGAEYEYQFNQGLHLLKRAGLNLVLANDLKTRLNMVITSEEALYTPTTVREAALTGLINIALARIKHDTFKRTFAPVGKDPSIPASMLPNNFIKVMDWLVSKNAFKENPLGNTPGHYGVKLGPNNYAASPRKVNHNVFWKKGFLIEVTFDGDRILSDAPTSVGVAYTQQLGFEHLSEAASVVHFHCPLKDAPLDSFESKDQWPYECGSKECAQNTVEGLKEYRPGIWAVMLDKHGPNIFFSEEADTQEIINFIDANFDLSRKSK